MERHHIDDQAAFDMLRDHSPRTNTKLVDVARAITEAHISCPATRTGRLLGPGDCMRGTPT